MAAEAHFWNKIAKSYAAKPVADPDAYQRKLDATKARLRRTDVVLDVGCGTGSLALELAPLVSFVHGVDISSEMVRIAEGKAEDQGIDNVAFHASTFDGLSRFEPASFDVVCAYNILHLVPDRLEALHKIAGLLKPGGTFVSSTPCLGEGWVPFGPLITVMRWFGKAPNTVRSFDLQELDETLTAAGFVDGQKPDVGAPSRTAFVLATKPAQPPPRTSPSSGCAESNANDRA